MIKRAHRQTPPRGMARLLYRAPAWFYRLHLGWILGQRFLLLTHRGRASGRARQTVLEVMRHDRATDTYFVAAGFGPRSNWLRNLQADAQTAIQVGRRHLDTQARILDAADAEQELLAYARTHPRALRVVARLLGYTVDGTEEDVRALSRLLPIVALGRRDADWRPEARS